MIPPEVANVIETIEMANFQAFLVGGCVRDTLIGKKPKDWDITTNAKPDQIIKLFPKTVYENVYGTVGIINENTEDPTIKNIEATPYRLESAYSDHRHPDEVKFSENIEDDLKRRDFTVNAIAMSVSKGSIKDMVDLYGGLKDIKDKTIRTVGEPASRFKEDALRMMRAIRLSVELDFSIEKRTLEAIKTHNALLKEVSIERIRDEFTKIILSPQPKQGIELLQSTNLLQYVVPELEKGIGVTQTQAHAYDVWEHLLRSLQHAADKEWPLDIRLAALFHDISKPKTKAISRETGQVTFYGHEMDGSRETRKILQRLLFSRETIEKVSKMVRWHMFFSDTDVVTLAAVRRLIVNVGKETIWDLMNLRVCDRIGTGRPKENPYRLRKYKAMIEEALKDPISLSMLKIDGKRLMEVTGVAPGPKIGHILHALFEEVLENPEKNTQTDLEKRALEMLKLTDAELISLGEAGKGRKEEENEKDIAKIRDKYNVK